MIPLPYIFYALPKKTRHSERSIENAESRDLTGQTSAFVIGRACCVFVGRTHESADKVLEPPMYRWLFGGVITPPYDFYGKWADIYKIFMKNPQIPLAFSVCVC